MNTTNVTAANWKESCEEISKDEFWDEMVFAPIKRMGFSDGPGGVFHGEPYDYQICSITKEKVLTRSAHFVVKDAASTSRYYRVNDPITLEEFKALCEVIIPGVGPCAWGYGENL